MTSPPDPSNAPPPDAAEVAAADFDAMLAAAQPRLKGYVAAIVGGWSDVEDLVQETNLVLLTKRHDFTAGTSFLAWAFRVAYFKATTWRRDRMREGKVVLTEMSFQELAARAEVYFGERTPMADMLAECLGRLSERDRALVNSKYVERQNLSEQAAAAGCSPNSLHKAISRIRQVLRTCLHSRLHSEGS